MMTETIKLSLLDTHFADFIVRIDRNPCNELWWGAALASNAAGRGDTCCQLADIPADPAGYLFPLPSTIRTPPPHDVHQWLTVLKGCNTVGTPGAYTPLVLDRAGRLYLHRCWHYEQQVATGILNRSTPPAVDEAALAAAVNRYFPDDAEDLQRAAAMMALSRRFSVITGGPGTGKTATVARILAIMLDVAGAAGLSIALTAPTGKAAARLHQSILRAVGLMALPDAIRSALPAEVTTIHRLLGVRGGRNGFRHNRDNPLSCDVLIVDEVSMVDLQLMAHLLEALRDDARIILLGDRNQLASVEAGAVLADICDSENVHTVPVTQLTRSYRFADDSGIAALSSLINQGNGSASAALMTAGTCHDVSWKPLPTGRSFEDAFTAAVRHGYDGFIRAAIPAEALAALNSFRVVAPLRSGPYGIENLNRLCQGALASRGQLAPVMVTGNNYELGLYNGDTGVIMTHDDTAAVWFETPEGGLRRLSKLRLPPCEAAFAMSVHKSQGSEFDRVLLILPDHLSEVLSRELLYTAVTRARQHIEIWGSEEIFRQTVERSMIRNSGLQDRLSGAAW